jgi:hypothetical protein
MRYTRESIPGQKLIHVYGWGRITHIMHVEILLSCVRVRYCHPGTQSLRYLQQIKYRYPDSSPCTIGRVYEDKRYVNLLPSQMVVTFSNTVNESLDLRIGRFWISRYLRRRNRHVFAVTTVDEEWWYGVLVWVHFAINICKSAMVAGPEMALHSLACCMHTAEAVGRSHFFANETSRPYLSESSL